MDFESGTGFLVELFVPLEPKASTHIDGFVCGLILVL